MPCGSVESTDIERVFFGNIDRDGQRAPAGLGGGAARFFQRGQEGVAEERVVGAGAGIPGGRIESTHAIANPGNDGFAAHFSVS